MSKNALMKGAVVGLVALSPIAAAAQTTTDTTTPGAPNTGAGGASAGNILLLVGSALAVTLGTAYLSRKISTR